MSQSNTSPAKICMLDIETLDTKPSAIILSIGAVDVYGSESFYLEFDRNTQDFRRTSSDDTLDWWSKQPIPMPNGSEPIDYGLRKFHDWYTAQNFTEVWCKGSDFDFVILKNAFDQNHMTTPWKYNEVRDFRTLSKVFPEIVNPTPYRVHNALTDAICQAAHLKEILSYVNGIRPQIYTLAEPITGTV